LNAHREVDMPFEKFVPPRREKSFQVSIKRTGTISFDKSYATTAGLAKASHVILYFDPSKKLVGVKAARDAKEDGALKLSHRQRVSSVRARSFFDHYGIALERTLRFPVRHDDEAGMAVIELSDVKRRRGPRKRRL
jgi:hypothetical protein